MAGILKSGQSLYTELSQNTIPSNNNTISNSSVGNNGSSLEIITGKVASVNGTGTSRTGEIEVEIIGNSQTNGFQTAIPLFPNIKNYPLKNETVVIIPSISTYGKTTYYYLSPVNLWNSNQTNPYQSTQDIKINNDYKGKSYSEVEQTGNPNKFLNASTNYIVGTYFNDENYNNPTYPYEGDYIIDGRFGNSLRFGNTVPNDIINNTQKNPNLNNNWSSTGSIGDPITILTNQKPLREPKYNSVTENINTDGSSAYFTSTQKIPILVSSTNNYLSYKTEEDENSQPEFRIITKTKKINFPSGDSGQEVDVKSQLTEILAQISSNPSSNSSLRILGSESQVPNPNNEAKGALASSRIESVKNILPSNINITSNTKIGNIPYTQGVDNPNDTKYETDQFVEVTLIQRIRIPNTNVVTSPPILPKDYTKKQIILNSGRLLFNSTEDHILLSSKKSINLNTVESVNIDAQTRTVIQSPEVYLGGVETSQPIVLGNDLVDVLTKVLDDLEALTDALYTSKVSAVEGPLYPANIIAQSINGKIGDYRAALSSSLSSYVKAT